MHAEVSYIINQDQSSFIIIIIIKVVVRFSSPSSFSWRLGVAFRFTYFASQAAAQKVTVTVISRSSTFRGCTAACCSSLREATSDLSRESDYSSDTIRRNTSENRIDGRT